MLADDFVTLVVSKYEEVIDSWDGVKPKTINPSYCIHKVLECTNIEMNSSWMVQVLQVVDTIGPMAVGKGDAMICRAELVHIVLWSHVPKNSENVLRLKDENKRLLLYFVFKHTHINAGKIWKLFKTKLGNALLSSESYRRWVVDMFNSHHTQGFHMDLSMFTTFLGDISVNKYILDTRYLLYLIILAPSAKICEAFAANRSEEFRMDCMRQFNVCHAACADIHLFANLYTNAPDSLVHNKFNVNMLELHKDFVYNFKRLLREMTPNRMFSQISHGWAMVAIKKCAKKYYVEKVWKTQQFLDVVCTVLQQRSYLKKDIVKVIQGFNDEKLVQMINQMQNVSYALEEETEKIETPDENCLSLDENVNVTVVYNGIGLRQLQNELFTLTKKSKKVLVGIDAEWSSYTSVNRATILQLSFDDKAFIIDLESKKIKSKCYMDFLNYFFLNSKIVKIGFQFDGDLKELQHTFPNCLSLYKPVNIICIKSIMVELLDKVYNTGLEENEKANYNSNGLSYFCQKLLGKPLNKTEQCSVWDRRPLRQSQIHYAALDAVVMVRLYEQCQNLCKEAGMDMKVLEDKSKTVSVHSLPLFVEFPPAFPTV